MNDEQLERYINNLNRKQKEFLQEEKQEFLYSNQKYKKIYAPDSVRTDEYSLADQCNGEVRYYKIEYDNISDLSYIMSLKNDYETKFIYTMKKLNALSSQQSPTANNDKISDYLKTSDITKTNNSSSDNSTNIPSYFSVWKNTIRNNSIGVALVLKIFGWLILICCIIMFIVFLANNNFEFAIRLLYALLTLFSGVLVCALLLGFASLIENVADIKKYLKKRK